MLRKAPLAMPALVLGVALGYASSHTSALRIAYAQEAGQILVKGHGRAISSLKPPDSEHFTLTASNAPRASFKVVPPGKKFVLTDVIHRAGEREAEPRGERSQRLPGPPEARHPVPGQAVAGWVGSGPPLLGLRHPGGQLAHRVHEREPGAGAVRQRLRHRLSGRRVKVVGRPPVPAEAQP